MKYIYIYNYVYYSSLTKAFNAMCKQNNVEKPTKEFWDMYKMARNTGKAKEARNAFPQYAVLTKTSLIERGDKDKGVFLVFNDKFVIEKHHLK